MRFIWTLVIACLVAAGGVRPEQELQRGPDAAKLSRDHAALAVIGTRRDHSARRELGIGVATLPEMPAINPPCTYAIVASRSEYAAPIAALVSPRSSRGPPVG
ncbi:MAG: hypothetical protein QM831_29770 [Kofleriaceae bacterium]